MAPRKRKPNASPDTDANSPGNGSREPDRLDYDGWLERVRADAGSLQPHVWAAESGADGRSFGSRLGKVPLVPLDDLDERLRAEWPGPRVLILRVKEASTGHIKHTARLHLAAGPTTTPTAPAGDLATLMALVTAQQRQLADLTARLAAAPAAPAAVPLGEQVGALGSVATVLKGLMPATSPTSAAPGLTVEDVQKLIDIGKRSAGDTSVSLEALRMLGPAGVDFLKASAGLLLMKMDNATSKDKP